MVIIQYSVCFAKISFFVIEEIV